MARTKGAGEIPAAQAALRLGISRERLIRLVQTRELKGRRDERGWWVELAGLERLKPRAAQPQP
jgi:hypothetical protein